ncbi:hypothetical protein SAMN02745163_00219 [Clostridium cavendishii DSM 21758]|uniref:Uncharacterized protein n=1 Tax=Clostridium cavendishii DSM 21758 TaxID=1121302 RepID=A0A1M6AZK4_9CLOT|nr:hypothetical protein [Clostridium cavendishii]SHI41944.1 hypothetical protein SAMN02745163_00219 [Clostridium cavendishii DSM 21758]
MDKVKVIIWGCGNLAKLAFKSLEENKVSFLGFTSNNNKDRENVHRYIDKKELSKIKFDYILIASQYHVEIIEEIMKLGIDASKVINFFKIHNRNFKLINYLNLKEEVDAVAIGMSYGECGINPEFLSFKLFNLALSSQDIYYDDKTLRYLIEKKKIRKVIFELPYYILNYDLSRTKNMDLCYTNYYYIFNDLHSYDKVDFNLNEFLIYENIINEKVYNDRFNEFYCSGNFEREFRIYDEIMAKESIQEVENFGDDIIKNYKLYFVRQYKDTIEENKGILEGLLGFLNKQGVNVYFVVTPSLLRYNNDIFLESKNKFHEYMGDLKEKYKFDLYDFFEDEDFKYADFKDYTHLNYNGSKKFTKKLNRKLKNNLEEL